MALADVEVKNAILDALKYWLDRVKTTLLAFERAPEGVLIPIVFTRKYHAPAGEQDAYVVGLVLVSDDQQAAQQIAESLKHHLEEEAGPPLSPP